MAKQGSGRPSWFKMFAHQKSVVDAVSDEKAGQALKACFQYFDNREIIDLDPAAFVVFMAIKPYIDESFADYERSVESGKKGGSVKRKTRP